MEKKIIVRCRGIILDGENLLVVKHAPNSESYTLPGGHLEWGEDIKECMIRELEEELGIKGEVGRLLFVNTFVNKDDETYSIEFFFEIKNSKDYAGSNIRAGTHANELYEVRWVKRGDGVKILPPGIHDSFQEGILLTDVIRFIRG